MADGYNSWTTDDFDVRHQYDAWDEELSTVYGRWSVSLPCTMKFSASVESRSMDSFKVIECICDPCGARRGHAEMLADNSDFLALQLVLDGYEQIRFAGEEAVKRGIVIVISTRVPDGRVLPVYGTVGGGQSLKEAGAVFADNLSPQKARILLMLALQTTSNVVDIQQLFDQ